MKPVAIAAPVRPGDPAAPLLRRLVERLESVERRLPRLPGSPPAPFTEERSLLARVDSRAADAAGFERQRVLHRALDEEYFQRELCPGCVLYENGGADAVSSTGSVMRLPVTAAGTNTMLHRPFLLRQLWPRTRARLTLWYTAPGSSTATFNLRFQARHYPAGGTVAGNLIFSTTLTPAGPAVANDVLTASVVGGAIMPAIAAPVRFAVARIGDAGGGGANPNSLDVLLAVVALEEVA